MDSERSDENNQFGKGGEALDLENDFNDSEDVEDEEENQMMKAGAKKDGSGAKIGPDGKVVKGKELENQPYDLAVDVNDSEEVDSEEDDDEVNAMESGAAGASAQ